MVPRPSPFKFLDAYDRDDANVFFGRTPEVEALYELTFQSSLILVYGASGTGKTSIIQCGLADCFRPTDWLEVFVRRRGSIKQSLHDEIRNHAKRKIPDDVAPLAAIEALFRDHFRPIYLIFDQFEELLIFGSEAEQNEFIATLQTIVASDVNCKIILSIREEYIAQLRAFEAALPTLFDHRIRIEPMGEKMLRQVIVNMCAAYGIALENGDATASRIMTQLGPRSGAQLAFLQVYLDSLWRKAVAADEDGPVVFTETLIAHTGQIDDVLGSFLDEQTAAIQARVAAQFPGVAPLMVQHLLEEFATLEGTKIPRDKAQVRDLSGAEDAADDYCLQQLQESRILRDADGLLELAHDSLALRVADRRSADSKAALKIEKIIRDRLSAFEQTGTWLNAEETTLVRSTFATLRLSPAEYDFYNGSVEKVAQAEAAEEARRQAELARERALSAANERAAHVAKQRTRWVAAAALVMLLLTALAGRSFFNAEKALIQASALLALQEADADPSSAMARIAKADPAGRFPISLFLTHWDEPLLSVALAQAAAHREFRRFIGHQDQVSSAAFSPDGRTIVTASDDYTARLWDVASGRELRKLVGHDGPVNSAAFSPDGRTIVTASNDRTARLWDATTGRELRKLVGHEVRVNSAAFSPDGRTIVTASYDNTARLWDVASGRELRKLVVHDGLVLSAAFSPDGRTIVTGSTDKTARLWDVASGRELRKLVGHEDRVYSAAFSPDGRTIVTASSDNTARLWDVASGRELRKLVGHDGAVSSAAFSPDGRTIVTASSDNTARLWDVASGRELRKLVGHEVPVCSAAFSPDGRTIVTGSTDKTARLWDVASGRELRKLVGHEEWVRSAAFSPDGRTIVTGSTDKTARLWDVATGRELRKLVGHEVRVNSAAFSPDGRTIVTASYDNTARLWDVASGRELRNLVGHQGWVRSATFSPDGRTIVTASADKTARLWDVASGRELRKLVGHSDAVTSAAFSPDGRTIVT
ncbi:eIF2A-related protein, partial [Polymorphobacter arshaanensis]|uniref:nSTAND1 domain-containing NTPase n=1 Tax=Glacieibacterium arshaanense TaxID=2511025 RepID=UPI00311CB784